MNTHERVYGSHRDNASLADVLLVLLAAAPATTHQLHQRHTATFGRGESVDHGRIASVMTRLEKGSYVTWHSVPGPWGTRASYDLTEAGRQRQHHWMHHPPPEAALGEIVVRGLLAAETANFAAVATFDSLLAATRGRQQRVRARQPMSAASAREAYDRAMTRAVASWLADLRQDAASLDQDIHK